MTFQAKLELHGKTATGIVVPNKTVEALGGGKRPPVKVSINGHTYESTVAARGDQFLLPVSAENREQAGVKAGDEVEVELELDTAPRTVDAPQDLEVALAAEPKAQSFFASLTASQKKSFVVPIEQAKQLETRERRIEKAISALRDERKRP